MKTLMKILKKFSKNSLKNKLFIFSISKIRLIGYNNIK